MSSLTVLVNALIAGQFAGASLTGVVRDANSAAPIVGARVSLADLDRSAFTDSGGRYEFRDVPAGPQHLQVRRLGYEARTLHALVPAGGALVINISLPPVPVPLQPLAGLAPPVAVRGSDPETDGEAPLVSLTSAQVRNHPLLAEPDFLVGLSGGAVTLDPETPRGLHVRGGDADQITYMLDGIPVFNPIHAAGLFSAWNPDALWRVKLDPGRSGEAAPDALTGFVSADTRPAGADGRVQGALSTTQARLTLDGSLPFAGGGLLVSGRVGLPGVFNPADEVSYLEGRSSDGLVRITADVAGGGLRLLAYRHGNRTDAAAYAGEPPPAADGGSDLPLDGRANRFAWGGGSWGAVWNRALSPGRSIRLRGWKASADATARWQSADPATRRLVSSRSDVGGAAEYQLIGGSTTTTLGVRAHGSRTAYSVGADSAAARAEYVLEAETPVVAGFARHLRSLGGRVTAEVGVLGGVYAGNVRLAPDLRLHWAPEPSARFTAGYARTYQAEQSLRNPESVVGYVFPPALYVGAGARDVPVARSNQLDLTAELLPVPGLRLVAQGFARESRELVLAAPLAGGPFAAEGVVVGSGSSRGASLDLALAGARYGVVGSYGYQRVRRSYGDTTYVPDFATPHLLEGGVVVFPQATTSLRLGVASGFGRRGTAISGPFEWEACNLFDRGCEFAGSPQRRGEALGSTRLPSYLRLDLSVRKHWHLRLAGSEGVLAAYATLTNLLGWGNVLTESVDVATGEREPIEMRARAPLLVGIDWRF